MIKLAVGFLLLALPAEAIATSKYAAGHFSCSQIRDIISREGAAIFRFPSPRKPQLTLYDRYVRNSMFCASHQVLQKVYIPASDDAKCPVSHCISAPDDCGTDNISPSCLFGQ